MACMACVVLNPFAEPFFRRLRLPKSVHGKTLGKKHPGVTVRGRIVPSPEPHFFRFAEPFSDAYASEKRSRKIARGLRRADRLIIRRCVL